MNMFTWFTNPEKYAESFLNKEEIAELRNKAKMFAPTAIQNVFYVVFLMFYFTMAITSVALAYVLNYVYILFHMNIVPTWVGAFSAFSILFVLTAPKMWVFYRVIMPSFMANK